MAKCEYCNEELTGNVKVSPLGKYYCQECLDEMTISDVCEEFDITAKEILDEMCNLREVNIEEEEQSEIDDFKYRQFVEDKMTEDM